MKTKKSVTANRQSNRPAPGADLAAPEQARRRDCVPCGISPFCRTQYFTGRLLTEQDFTAEQRYFRDKIRLHHRALHGWGVACGLRVKPHPFCPDRRLVIEPGLAIDQCGYEIVIAREVELELPPAPEPPARSAKPPYGNPEKAPAYQPEPTHSHPPYDPSTPIYICLRYSECETDFMPAPFDECGCNDAQGRRASRICESYTLTLRYGTPESLEPCPSECDEILHEPLGPCPAPEEADCIPLAYLPRYVPGETVTDDMIDNRSYRPLLPSTRVHDRLLRCILPRVSANTLTRVSAIRWTHGQEYTCGDFIRFFTGTGSDHGAFEVTFDQPVRPECLTPRIFQATIARFGGAGRPSATPLEIAPARVWPGPTRTSYLLQVDRDYAERELRGRWFDVYLTLRCNLVLDDRGRAVDGELMASMQDGDFVVSPPTGNGVPGGTLESWIRVRP